MPRRASTKRSTRRDSPISNSASGTGTGFDTPNLGGTETPATRNASTPGTTPSLEESVPKTTKGKGKSKRPLPSDSELSEVEDINPSTGRGESAAFSSGRSDALNLTFAFCLLSAVKRSKVVVEIISRSKATQSMAKVGATRLTVSLHSS